jgi:hypothetical protein
MKRHQKPLDLNYVKPAQTPWLTKDDVAKQLRTVNRTFEIADDGSSAWLMDDGNGATPDLPNWGVLLHSDIYGPIKDTNEGVKRKYFGYVPRENVQ